MIDDQIANFIHVLEFFILHKVYIGLLPYICYGAAALSAITVNYVVPGAIQMSLSLDIFHVVIEKIAIPRIVAFIGLAHWYRDVAFRVPPAEFLIRWRYDPLLLAILASILFCILYPSFIAVSAVAAGLAWLCMRVYMSQPERAALIANDAYMLLQDLYTTPSWARTFFRSWNNARMNDNEKRIEYVRRVLKIAGIDFNFISISGVQVNYDTPISPFSVGHFYRTSRSFHESDLLWAVSNVEYKTPSPLTRISMNIMAPSLASKYNCEIAFNLTINFNEGHATKYFVANCRQRYVNNRHQSKEIPLIEGAIEAGNLSLETILSGVSFDIME